MITSLFSRFGQIRFLSIIGMMLLPVLMLAQKGWSVTPTIHTGFVLKHTSKLKFDNSGISEGLTVNLQYQTHGLASWEVEQNYPQVGIQVAFFRLSIHPQLGNAFGLVPNLTIPFIRKETWALKGQFGLGVAWLTKHYDPIANPLNNAVGSHLNNYTTLSFFAEKKWSDRLKMTSGLSFSHFSNGSAQLPNYGINVPALALGIQYSPTPLKKEDFKLLAKDTNYRKWGFMIQTTAARREFIGLKGPKYLIYNIEIAGTYAANAVNTSFIGIEYEYNYTIVNFFKFHEQYDDKTVKDTGRRMMIFLGHEFAFGAVGLGGQAGLYVGPYKTMLRNTFYNKINLKYHFAPFGKKGLKPFIGLYMKAHLAEAEYIAVGLGLRL